MRPLFTVVIDTYNYGRFIEGCIDSVLAQDLPAEQREIIVVDDGSTDDTAERVRKYGNDVRYIHKENGDYVSAIILGFQHSNGELIALLDGDDVWLPNKLSRVAEEFAKDPRTTMVYHKYAYWDTRDNRVWDPGYVAEVSGDVLADRRKLLAYSTAPTSSLVFRREVFGRMIDVPLNRGFTYDLFLTTAVLFLGPVACISEVLTKQRVHGNNRWVVGQESASAATLQRRIARWQATMEIMRDWIRKNTPKSSRPQARILLRRWQLFQDSQELLLKPPGRFRDFAYRWRAAPLELPASGANVAYRRVHALAGLIVGERARYLEAIRTRVNRIRVRLQGRNNSEQTA